MAAEGHSPLAQFEIKTLVPLQLGGSDVSFTNSALFMSLAVILVASFLVLSMRKRALVPGRWQSMAELSYEFVANLLRDTVGNEGRKYFPFVFTLFMFILFANLLGLLPLGAQSLSRRPINVVDAGDPRRPKFPVGSRHFLPASNVTLGQ